MKKESVIENKTFDFAIKMIGVCNNLFAKNEYTLTKQLLKSATSIGANVAEGERAQTKADFLAKMNIALKEANETKYWIRLLHATNYIVDEYENIINEIDEIISILVAITKHK